MKDRKTNKKKKVLPLWFHIFFRPYIGKDLKRRHKKHKKQKRREEEKRQEEKTILYTQPPSKIKTFRKISKKQRERHRT